jgi:hypothetical protein
MPMTNAKMMEALERCRETAVRLLVRDGKGRDREMAIQKVTSMVLAARVFVVEGRREKAMRWLGFIQGVLWMLGVPLEDLKNMNRPDPS